MSHYSTEEKVTMIEFWYLSEENVTLFQRKWHRAFKNAPLPGRNTVLSLVRKFEEKGIVTDD